MTEEQSAKTLEEQPDQDPSAIEPNGSAKTEDLEERNSEVETSEQSKEEQQEIQIDAEAEKQFKGLGYEREDLEEFTADELRDILDKKLKKEVETKTLKEQSLITEELARLDRSGFAKNLIGQPIERIMDAYNSQAQMIQTLTAKVKELEKPENNNQNKINEEIDSVDFVDLEPAEQKQAILRIVEHAIVENTKSIEEKLEKKFGSILKPVEKIAQQEALQELANWVKKHDDFPDGMDSAKAVNDWIANSGFTPEERVAIAQSPKALTDLIVSYALKSHRNKEAKKKSKITFINEVKKKLKEVDGQPVKGSKFNAAQKRALSKIDEDALKIINRNFS